MSLCILSIPYVPVGNRMMIGKVLELIQDFRYELSKMVFGYAIQ